MNSASSVFCGEAFSNATLAAAPERRVLGDVEGVAQLVGDDDRADTFEVAQLDDFLVHGDRRDRIEAGRRLVVEQDARLGRHRPGDGHAPPLAARQLRRLAVDEIGQADEAEDFLDARVGVGRLPVQLLEQLVADVLADRQRVEERPFLEHHPEVVADAHHVVLGHVVHLLAVDEDLAAIGLEQAEDQPQDRRLAGAAGAEKDLGVPGLQREADAVRG